MIAGNIAGNGGWQTTIADLALILFMVSVAAIANQPDGAGEGDHAAAALVNPLPAMGEPVAIYRGGAGMPGLDRWLADQTPDARQQLTVIARYPVGGAQDAAGAALALADQAGAAGYRARILLEPSPEAPTGDVIAVLGYDGGEGDGAARDDE